MKTGEDLFIKIKNELEAYLNDNQLTGVFYSIVGSPIIKASNMIISSNWAGDRSLTSSQNFYPEKSDLLTLSESKTYNGYTHFLTDLLKDDNSVKTFIENSILLNVSPFIVPNQSSKENLELILEGKRIFEGHLKEIIQFAAAKNLLCFGKLAFDSINELLGAQKGDITSEKKIGTYYYLHVKKDNVNIFKLPHASRYGSLWSMSNNEFANELRSVIR